jgi:hypothetical protein
MPHATAERALIALAGLILAAGVAQAQTMYKWVDEKGTTHFSENPPPDDGKTKASKVEPKVTPPSSPASASRDTPEKWRAQEADFKRRQVERNQREETSEREKAQRANACESAKRRVAFLANTHRIFRDNADGSRTWLTDSQREQEIDKMRDVVREKCD